MIIQEENFKLTPINESSNLFDLELLYEIGGKNPRKEFKVAAYGIPLNSAIERIIRFTLNNNYKDKIITLKEYLDSYKNVTEEIKRKFQ